MFGMVCIIDGLQVRVAVTWVLTLVQGLGIPVLVSVAKLELVLRDNKGSGLGPHRIGKVIVIVLSRLDPNSPGYAA
jgi:hypothetical protein